MAVESEPFRRVKGYLDSFIAFFAGGEKMDDEAYAAIRNDLRSNPAYEGLAPEFIEKERDAASLWSFAKSIDPSWEPRRRYLREQFDPLLTYLETGKLRPTRQMPGPYDAGAWTGIQNPGQRLRAVQTLIPVAQAAIGALIRQLEAPTHNGGPRLDEVEQALESLRRLHSVLGDLLATAEAGNLNSAEGEGLMVEASRYGRRAAKALKSDPVPYALSAAVLAVLSACGAPDIAGYLAGIAMAIQKPKGQA